MTRKYNDGSEFQMAALRGNISLPVKNFEISTPNNEKATLFTQENIFVLHRFSLLISFLAENPINYSLLGKMWVKVFVNFHNHKES